MFTSQGLVCHPVVMLCIDGNECKVRAYFRLICSKLSEGDDAEKWKCLTLHFVYAGVATFCRTATAVPLAADEGFTGTRRTYRTTLIFTVRILSSL